MGSHVADWSIAETTQAFDRLSHCDQQLLWRIVATMHDACDVPHRSVSVADAAFTRLRYGRITDLMSPEVAQLAGTAGGLGEATYHVGDVLEAKSSRRGVTTWYGARVAEVRPNGGYLIEWDHGGTSDREKWPAEIRKKPQPAAAAARRVHSI